jgi:hypothetical protein
MENLAYLHLALAYETAEQFSFSAKNLPQTCDRSSRIRKVIASTGL